MKWWVVSRQAIAHWRRLMVLWSVIGIALLLSGCVRYDVGLHFVDQHHGEIVQHIQIKEQLTSFSDSLAQQWLQNIKQRTRQVGGRFKQVSPQELVATIPFNNGAELVEKFNQFFSPKETIARRKNAPDLELPSIPSQLKIQQSNALLVERNHLTFDLDLRSLGLTASDGSLLLSPGNLVDLTFGLSAPWGARVVPGSLSPDVQEQGNQLLWTLQVGDINHLEVVFWVPSPLGIGTAAIALLTSAGFFLRNMD